MGVREVESIGVLRNSPQEGHFLVYFHDKIENKIEKSGKNEKADKISKDRNQENYKIQN